MTSPSPSPPRRASLICLADLRFLSAHEGSIESCASCGQSIRHGHACAVAVLRILDKDGLPGRQNWGLIVCSHCRNLPQEKLLKAILHRSMASASNASGPSTAFEAALLHAVK